MPIWATQSEVDSGAVRATAWTWPVMAGRGRAVAGCPAAGIGPASAAMVVVTVPASTPTATFMVRALRVIELLVGADDGWGCSESKPPHRSGANPAVTFATPVHPRPYPHSSLCGAPGGR